MCVCVCVCVEMTVNTIPAVAVVEDEIEHPSINFFSFFFDIKSIYGSYNLTKFGDNGCPQWLDTCPMYIDFYKVFQSPSRVLMF